MAGGDFLTQKENICGCSRNTHRLGVMLKGEGGGMTTPLLQHVARFDGGGEIVGFGGGNKDSMPWCSLFVGFPSLEVVAVCTCISSQKSPKGNPRGGLHTVA